MRIAFASCLSIPLCLSLSPSMGCTSDEWPPIDLEEDTGSSSSSGGPDFDGASLDVIEPEAASVHRIGETVPLVAEVRDLDGFPLEGAEVIWKLAETGEILLEGPEGEVELPPGVHDLVAVARFPNGDRLENTVGDVRVQSRWTGIYAGDATLNLAIDFQGTPLNPSCTGPLAMQVGVDGSTVVFEGGSCTINVIVTSLQLGYTIEGTFQDGVAEGTVVYDIAGFLMIPLQWRGAFIEDGFGSGFGGPLELPIIGNAEATGVFSAQFVSPYVEL